MSNLLSEEIEKTRREIRELKDSITAGELREKVFSEFIDFGLWEYDISADVFRVLKKPNGNYLGDGEPIEHFRESVLSRGIVCAEDLPEFNSFCDSMQRGDKTVSCEMRVVRNNMEMSRAKYEGKTVFDLHGKPIKVIGRITESQGKQKDRSGVNYDSLTGLYTAEYFREIIRERRTGVNRYDNGVFLSVGIDNFREFDEQSKDKSDLVQKELADILSDIASANRKSAVTRVRGGEFLMYISYAETDAEDKIAKKILSAVGELVSDNNEIVRISIGVSYFKNNSKTEDVYAEAVRAMREARKSGGGCYMRYSPRMNLSGDYSEGELSLSADPANIYDLIIKAFCNEKGRSPILKSAFKAAGQSIGATVIKYYAFNGENKDCYTLFSTAPDTEELPGVKQICSNGEIINAFDENGALRVFTAGDSECGLELCGGAVCAECRLVGAKNDPAGYFVVIFGSAYELSQEDLDIIDALKNALSRMYNVYSKNKLSVFLKGLYGEIISDHRMEAISIIPGTFVVDYAGENAAERYDMKPGDICYKKMRGRNEPCVNCPAVKLLENGGMHASSAFYDEKSKRWLDIAASVCDYENGDRRYIISSTDITDCLGKIRMTDALTGAMTFDSFTAEALNITSEDKNGFFISVINIAQFRRINETQGFETGNAILVTVADILLRCARENEIVCRNEGTRFIVLFRAENNDELYDRISSLMNSIQKQVFDKTKIQIYLAAGICSMGGEDDIEVMGALDRAITAQHTVKDSMYSHANQIVFYDGALREAIRDRHIIEANMQGALENGEFKVYYQPKVNIETGAVVGAEALVRWITADGQMISPGKFIPIFEQNGFITDMDFAIYRSAVADIARWLRNGIKVPLISLNVSRYHLGDAHFCEKLVALVDSLGVPHEFIELEITESLLTENLEKLVETVTWFKQRGFKISVDDFGSGYSSLNLITQLPFDTLKIDGGFFLRNDLTDKNKKVITSVVTLAKSLNLETVSEGVETQTQVDFLRDLGCDMIQGFFYYRPMPGRDFEKLLIAQTVQM